MSHIYRRLHRSKAADLACTERCVLMRAEAVRWRCHRSMIGDALLVRGIRGQDIIGRKARKPDILAAFGHVERTQIAYPAPFPTDTDTAASQDGTFLGDNHAP